MNKKVDLNDLKIFNSPDDLAEYHYFPKILKRTLEFDLAVHKKLFETKPHIVDEIDGNWLAFLNRGVFHRAFTRAVSEARAKNTWYTLKEISSKIFSSEKSVRNIFNECRDSKMINWRHDGNRLILQANDRCFRVWKRYTRNIIFTITEEFDDLFRDMQEYQRLKNMVDPTRLDPQKKEEATS